MKRFGIGIMLIEMDSPIQGRNLEEYWELLMIESKQCAYTWRRYKAISQPQTFYTIQDIWYVPYYLKNSILNLLKTRLATLDKSIEIKCGGPVTLS